ncbi:MAG: hypothetical protein II821_02900 [Treponema sp.]|nr:hypothetical protein [Treponema sp.]
MTNAEMKEVLTKGGVSEEVVEKISEKFDFEKITELIDGANEPEEAIEAIHNFYPELDHVAGALVGATGSALFTGFVEAGACAQG